MLDSSVSDFLFTSIVGNMSVSLPVILIVIGILVSIGLIIAIVRLAIRNSILNGAD